MTINDHNQVAFNKSTDGGNNWAVLKTSNAATPVSDDVVYSAGHARPTGLTFMLELNSGDKIKPMCRPNHNSLQVYLPHSFFCGELISAL